MLPVCPGMSDSVRRTEGLCVWMQGDYNKVVAGRVINCHARVLHSPLAAVIAVWRRPELPLWQAK